MVREKSCIGRGRQQRRRHGVAAAAAVAPRRATAARCAHNEALQDRVEDENDVDAAVGDEEAVSPSVSGDVHEAHLHGRHDGCEDERKGRQPGPSCIESACARIDDHELFLQKLRPLKVDFPDDPEFAGHLD